MNTKGFVVVVWGVFFFVFFFLLGFWGGCVVVFCGPALAY